MTSARRITVLALLAAGCGGRSLYLENDDSAEPEAGAPGSSSGGRAGDTSGGGSGAASGGADRGGTTSGDTGGSQSRGGSDNGGTSSDTGGSGGAPATGGSAGSVDANCHPGLAVSGATCTMDCSGVPCGFADLGIRSCECVGGYYSGCHCPRPSDYLGAHTAPPCDTVDGRALPLRHEPCDEEWVQCIGTDPVEGSIPRGCVCLPNPLNGDQLTWFCGSTNRWFLPE